MWKEKLKSGNIRYSERYTDPLTGKARRVSVTIKPTGKVRTDDRTAREALDRKIKEKETPFTTPETITFEELARRRVTWQEQHHKPQTAHSSQTYMTILTRAIGADTLVSKLTASVSAQMLSCDSPTMYNERLKHFKSLMRWGYRQDLVKDIAFLDKMQPAKEPSIREKNATKFLEHDEIEKLLKGMDVEKRRLLTEFLILSGLRIGEAIALDDADVDIKAREIHVTKTHDRITNRCSSTKTETSCRVVYMQDELLSCCRRIKAFVGAEKMLYGYHSPIFIPDVNTGGYLSYDAYSKYFRENTERLLGRRLSVHSLRHTHTAMMAEAGVPLDMISRRLGHADSKVTREVYLHVTEKMKDRENKILKNVRIL